MRAALLLLALTIGFYSKLTLSRQYTFLDWPDLAYQVLPWYQFQARAWHSGRFPLWDPYQWCGQSLVGQLQPGATFPLNWPLFWAPLRAGRLSLDLFHWHFVLMHWLAALFMYSYCRELQRSRFASVLAAAGFCLGGYLTTTTWPQMMNGALWAPLIFLFYHRAGRTTGLAAAANAAACGATMGFALLAGHHQAPMFILLALGAVFLWDFFTSGDRRRRAWQIVLVVAFAALVGAFALLPAWEYGSRAYRWVNLPSPLRMNQRAPYNAQISGLIPLSLLGVVTPVEKVTSNPFVGVVGVTLSLLGLAACWKERAVRLHACLALGGLAYALGSYSVFQGLLYAVVPFLDKARSPGHAVLLFQFGLLVVAAHGADALCAASPWRVRLVKGLLGGAALLGGSTLLLWSAGVPPAGHAESLMFTSLAALLLAALMGAASRRPFTPKWAQAGLLLLLLAETSAASAYAIRPRTNPQTPNCLDQLQQHRSVIEFLRSQPRPFRFYADDAEIPYNVGDWEGLDDTAGYLASVSADLYDFVGLDWTRTVLMLNQVYVASRQKTRPEQVEVFSEPGGLKVFRNPDAFPRAWLVRRVRAVPDHVAAVQLFGSSDFDPKRETFLVGPQSKAPFWEPCEGEAAARYVANEIHRVDVTIRTACPGMLVVSDPLFPGWQASVDGNPAALYAAYGALRGVVVPAGEHVVEMHYRPRSVYLGGALSAIGLAGCLLLAAIAKRESRKSGGRYGP